MKSIYEMTGVERAAALLIALGPDVASEILKNLDEESVNKISVEIAKIDKLSVEDKENLIGEFLLEIKKNQAPITGGENVARDLLTSAFGEEKAENILKKLTPQSLEKGFAFLKDIDSETLVTLLQNEQSQTIAVALAHLPSQKSAEIMQLLPSLTAKEVAVKLAKMDKTSPEAVLEIARVIRKRYEDLSDSGQGFQNIYGVDALVDILNHMGGDHEKKLMQYIDVALPDISNQIREKIYTFENIANLNNSEMRLLIDEIGDDFIIARSLKGAGDDIRFKFLRNMSRNRATDVLTDIDSMGPVRTSEIQESRDIIVARMRELHESGMIDLRKTKEKYVE